MFGTTLFTVLATVRLRQQPAREAVDPTPTRKLGFRGLLGFVLGKAGKPTPDSVQADVHFYQCHSCEIERRKRAYYETVTKKMCTRPGRNLKEETKGVSVVKKVLHVAFGPHTKV